MMTLFFAGLVSCAFAQAQSQDDTAEENEIFRSQVEHLNERYENFFSHQQEQRLYSESLKQGIASLKEQRRTDAQTFSAALRQYKLEPRERPDTTAMEAEHEAQKKAAEREYDRHRRSFVVHRNQLKRISESARKIPENQDAGLE